MIVIIALLIIVSSLFYYLITKPYKYFEDRGIDYVLTRSPWVDTFNFITGRNDAFQDFLDMYKNKSEKPFLGGFIFKTPEICIRDPNLIRQVTTKDADHFRNRLEVFVDPVVDKFFSESIFFLKNERWHNTRTMLTPTFTGKQMRRIFESMNACGVQMANHFKKLCDEQGGTVLEIDIKDAATKFANDMIATAALGVHCDSFANPENEFYGTTIRMMSLSPWRFFLKVLFPKLARFLRVAITGPNFYDYFIHLVKDTIATRKQSKICRPDMMQLLLQVQAEQERQDSSEKTKKLNLSDDDIVAQSTIFFFAGFEVVSNSICFQMYEIAVNPTVQAKLHQEIEETLSNHPEGLTYDALQTMKYLDMVISETHRKWPTVGGVDRCCTKRYTLKSSDGDTLVVEPGVGIHIPILGLHRDEKYWPDPDKFDPERFSDERKHEIVPNTYLPFGSGVRACIGSRYSVMESKVFLFNLLANYTFEVIEQTPIPLPLKQGIVSSFTPEGRLWIGLKPKK